MRTTEPYEVLAEILHYPGEDFPSRLARCRETLGSEGGVAAALATFADCLAPLSAAEREELYIRAFDMNPAGALEIGWHLFGETYDRGAFLVKMREALRRYGLPESSELPDHLIHVLPILGRMEKAAADSFADACVLPALEKIVAALEKKSNPYEYALGAVRSFVKSRHEGFAEGLANG